MIEPTTTPPTGEGVYWAYSIREKEWLMVSVELNAFDPESGRLDVWKHAIDYHFALTDFSWWIGPFPKPEKPR